jgi:hypothetical protein
MSIEDKDELSREFSEFGYRDTSDPDVADRRNYYKVELWDTTESHIIAYSREQRSNKCPRYLHHTEGASAARPLHASSGHPRVGPLAAPCALIAITAWLPRANLAYPAAVAAIRRAFKLSPLWP